MFYNKDVRKLSVFIVVGWACVFLCCKQKDSPSVPAVSGGPDATADLQAKVPFTGRIVFQSDMDGDSEIYLLTSGELIKLTDNAWEDRYPRWSPNGKKIAFLANPGGQFDVYVMNDDGRSVTAVTNSSENETDVAWTWNGEGLFYSIEDKKLFGREDTLWMIVLGSGEKHRAVPNFSGSHGIADVSPSDPWLTFTGKATFGWDVFLYDWSARRSRQLTEGGQACRARFSPDGRKIVFVSHAASRKSDIWTMNLDSGDQQRITERNETYDYFPSWGPDGDWIVFCSNEKDMYADKGDWGLYLVDVKTKQVSLLFDSPGRDVFPDWQRRIVPATIGNLFRRWKFFR
jgi:Tol biopolymer transport system component